MNFKLYTEMNEDIPSWNEALDNPEQRELQNNFIQMEKGVYNRPACPRCCPRLEGKPIRGWVKGRADQKGAYQCTNCGYTQTFTARKKVHSREAPTPSQQRKIDKIKDFFEKHSYGRGLKEFTIKPDEYGGYWVSVRTDGNVFIESGGFFHVTGHKVECAMAYDLNAKKLGLQDHYTKMLN